MDEVYDRNTVQRKGKLVTTMSVKTREELLNSFNTIVGENADDAVLEFISDMTDTFDDYEAKSSIDWEQRYNDNDAMWRKKYKDRFFGKSDNNDEEFEKPTDPRKANPIEKITIKGLFTKV